MMKSEELLRYLSLSFLPPFNQKFIIVHTTQNNQEIKIIRNYINEYNLTGFIVGIPLDERGQMTTQAIDCKNYGQLLSNELNHTFYPTEIFLPFLFFQQSQC